MDLVPKIKKQKVVKEKKQKVVKDNSMPMEKIEKDADKEPVKQKDKVKASSMLLKSKIAEVSKISMRNKKEIDMLTKKLDKVLSKLK